tara:strand:- start:644 stop:898 length:255 start_codon:yes stop_codon:yes gene_type:complete
MIKRLRSLDKMPKWILFFGIVGSVCLFGIEEWFYYPHIRVYKVHWEWVFLTTFLTAFFSYWLLFVLRKKNMKRSVTIRHKKKKT